MGSISPANRLPREFNSLKINNNNHNNQPKTLTTNSKSKIIMVALFYAIRQLSIYSILWLTLKPQYRSYIRLLTQTHTNNIQEHSNNSHNNSNNPQFFPFLGRKQSLAEQPSFHFSSFSSHALRQNPQYNDVIFIKYTIHVKCTTSLKTARNNSPYHFGTLNFHFQTRSHHNNH